MTDYDTDFHAWALRQAELIRQGRFAEIDVENVAEELEGVALTDRGYLEGYLETLLSYLLRYQLQPHLRTEDWRMGIEDQRRRAQNELKDSPSLRPWLDDPENWRELYRRAVYKTLMETELEEARLPASCPFSVEQALNDGFLPT